MSQRHGTPAPTINSRVPESTQAHTLEDGDPKSMTSILLAPLNDLQSLAHTLFLSLSPAPTKPPPPPPLSAFLDCDRALASAINLAHVHQIKQRKIESLEQEIFDLEARWREICRELATGSKELEALIEEGDERIKAIDAAKEGSFKLFVISLSLSHSNPSRNTLPRTPGICTKPQHILVCSSKYA
mgnify:CR=1 FL=1